MTANVMAAPRSRPARMLPSALASAPANFALTPSSLISLREDTTCPPTSRASAGTPVTSNADARRAASATEAEKRRSDPGRPSVRSVPVHVRRDVTELRVDVQLGELALVLQAGVDVQGAGGDHRQVEVLEHRADIRVLDLQGEVGAVEGIQAAQAALDVEPELLDPGLERHADVSPREEGVERPQLSRQSVVAYRPTRPLPEIASRSAVPGAMVSVSRSATRSGLPGAR